MSIKEERKRASKEQLKGRIPPASVGPESTIRDPRVRIVIDFMKANLHQKISSTDFAREAKLTVGHLSRLFNLETGRSPGEFLLGLRMEKARHLLTTGLLSIKEIMAMVGYGNRGHFVQHFRRYTGLPPSEFRKSL